MGGLNNKHGMGGWAKVKRYKRNGP